MSRVLPAKDICERALRAIGQFPVTESAADGEQLREAMTWLDLYLGELAGTNRIFTRDDPVTLSMPITNGTQSYNLFTALGTDLPADRIQFVIEAWIEDASGNRSPVEIVSRSKFENVCKPDETGKPCFIFVDEQLAPILRLHPTPAATDTTEYTLRLLVQRYAPNVAPSGVTGTQPSASVLHQMGQAWQRHLVFQLSHDLGSGPVTKIGESSLTRFSNEALRTKAALLAFTNREHVTSETVCEPWGM